jgi:hypothetical protein
MQQWHELEGLSSDECDSLIWKYESSGDYSTSSMYAIINFSGVTPIHILGVCQLIIPPQSDCVPLDSVS